MKRSMVLATLALGALAFAASGAAHPKPEHAKKSSFRISHKAAQDPTKVYGPPVHARSDVYGPYSVTSTDNGCSGAPWATDTLSRTFVVKRAKAIKSEGSAPQPGWRGGRHDPRPLPPDPGRGPGHPPPQPRPPRP